MKRAGVWTGLCLSSLLCVGCATDEFPLRGSTPPRRLEPVPAAPPASRPAPAAAPVLAPTATPSFVHPAGPAASGAKPAPALPLSIAQQAVARRLLLVWNEGQLDLIDALCHRDYTRFDPAMPLALEGREQMRSYVQTVRTAYPDLTYRFEEVLPIGSDRLLIRWTLDGTNRGPLGELPATNRPIHAEGASLLRLADESITEERVYVDQAAILYQLGFEIDPPRGAGGK